MRKLAIIPLAGLIILGATGCHTAGYGHHRTSYSVDYYEAPRHQPRAHHDGRRYDRHDNGHHRDDRRRYDRHDDRQRSGGHDRGHDRGHNDRDNRRDGHGRH